MTLDRKHRTGARDAALGRIQFVRACTPTEHRAETNSTYCRYCGAHPQWWGEPCLTATNDSFFDEAVSAWIAWAKLARMR